MSEMYDEDQPWHLTQEPEEQPSYEELADRIEGLEANALVNRVAIMMLEAKLAKAVEALEKLARLGNGERYGNSDGNMIARTTLAELKGQDDE